MANKERIVVLYVKSFTWKDAKLKEEFLGHPQVGRIYRGIKNEETGTYRLKVDESLGSDLQGLQLDELSGKFVKWNCDIEELDEDKLASYDIEVEDYLKIKDWTDTKNIDLKPLLESSEENDYNEKETTLAEAYPIEQSMKIIEDNDTGVADALIWFAAMVAASYENKPNIDTAIDIHMLPTEVGKGANMALSLDRINKYLNAPTDFPPYIAQSAFYHMLEIARLNTIDER